MNIDDLTAQTRVYLDGIATPEITAAEQDLDQCRAHDMAERLVAVVEGHTDEFTAAEARVGALFADNGDYWPFWKVIAEIDEDNCEFPGTELLVGPPDADDERQEVKAIDLENPVFAAYAAAIGPVCALMLLTAARRPDLARMDFIEHLEVLANRIEPDEQDWGLTTDEWGAPFVVTWTDPEDTSSYEGFDVSDRRVADHLIEFSPAKVLAMIAAIREARA